MLAYYFRREPSAAERRHNFAFVALAGWCWYAWSLLKEAEGTWLASGCTSITVMRRIIWTRCWTGTVREATKGSAMKGFGRMKFGLTSGLLWGLDTVVLGIGLSMSLSSALPRRLRLQLSRAPLCMTSSARSGC